MHFQKRICLLLMAMGYDLQLFARAGGGGGGGNAVKGIGILISIIYTIVLVYYVKKRNRKAKALIDESHKTDPLWEYDKMIALSKDVFCRMQQAWTERDMDLVADIVTESLYLDYKKKLDWMKVTHTKNIIEAIDIRTIKIVGDQDYDYNEWFNLLPHALSHFENIVVVGHSFGGMLIMLTPLLENMVNGVVILNSTSSFFSHNLSGINLLKFNIIKYIRTLQPKVVTITAAKDSATVKKG